MRKQFFPNRKLSQQLVKIGIEVLYLFGSRATNEHGPLSDYDFATLFPARIKSDQYFEKKMTLMRVLSLHLKNEKIDIVVLNEAPPLLALNCIDPAKIVFERKKDIRIDFETRTVSRYLDFLPYARLHYKTLINSYD